MEVINNTENKQFEVLVDEDLASMVYRFKGKTMFFMHTKVPESARGKGVASLLIKTALEFAKSKKYKIAILCPFVSKYIKNNPEWYALYDEEYHRIPKH